MILVHLYFFDLLNKIKWDFFQVVSVNTTVWMYHMNADKTEKSRWELPKKATSYSEQILKATPHKTTVQPLIPHLKNHPSKTDKTYRTLLEK